MIKINLAKMSGSATAVNVEAAVTSSGPSQPLTLPIKLVIIFILPVALYIWEDIVISKKIVVMKASKEKLTEIRTQIDKLGAVTAVVQSLSVEKDRLQKQLAVIGEISSKRAFKLKTISEMLRALPRDCWLEEVNISKDDISFVGYSRSPSSVQNLVDGLVKLKFLGSVFNKELKRTKIGEINVHQFNIVAEVKR